MRFLRSRWWRRDSGLSQSTSVGTLVVAALAISTGLTVYGPRVGGDVADYFACRFGAGQAAACGAGPAPVAGPPPGLPVGVGADPVFQGGPMVIDIPPDQCSGADDTLRSRMPTGRWESAQLLGAVPGAPPVAGTWNLAGCRLTVDADGPPAAKELSWWHTIWTGTVTMLVLIGVGFGVAALCAAAVVANPFLAPLEVWCPSIASAMAGFTSSLVASAVNGDPINKAAWTRAFLAALGGLVMGRMDRALLRGPFVAGLIRNTATTVEEWLAGVPPRVRSWAAAGTRWVLTFLENLAADIEQNGLELPELPGPGPGPTFNPHPI